MQHRPKHLPRLVLALAVMGIMSQPANAELSIDDRLRAMELRLNRR